jgi:putative addiction module component (TIGR02574 family)
MATTATSELLKLDVQTRLKIIDELWESVVNDLNDPDKPNALPVSEETRALLDEQMREYAADPTIGRPWAEVYEQLLKMT